MANSSGQTVNKPRTANSRSISSVTDLIDLVEALPECSNKATLRGLAVAARALHGESLDPQLVTRVNRVVTSWVRNDPLRELEEALRGRLEDGATPA